MRRAVFALILLVAMQAAAEKTPLIKNVSRNLGATSGGTIVTLFGNNPFADRTVLRALPDRRDFRRLARHPQG